MLQCTVTMPHSPVQVERVQVERVQVERVQVERVQVERVQVERVMWVVHTTLLQGYCMYNNQRGESYDIKDIGHYHEG